MRRPRPAMSRRAFLRAGTGAVLALPLLTSVRGARASALPKRLVVFMCSTGTIPDRLFPVPAGMPTARFTAQPEEYFTSGASFLDTEDYQISPILEPLLPYKEKLLVLEGLDNCTGFNGHGAYGSLLTGAHFIGPEESPTPPNESFDQLVARHVGPETPFPSLQLGVVVSIGYSPDHDYCSWFGPNQPAPAENDPRVIFDKLFGELSLSDDERERIRLDRRSVLDAMTAELASLERKLPTEDRLKVQQHLESIRQVETRLIGVGAPGRYCMPHPRPEYDFWVDTAWGPTWNDEEIPNMLRGQMDNIATAFACDLTRVVTLQFGEEGFGLPHWWVGVNDYRHHLSHDDDSNPESVDKITRISRWYAQELGYLIDKLASIPEDDGTVLDNTAIVWMHGITKGNSHASDNHPTLIAGGLGGALRTGRYVRFPTDRDGNRHKLNDLWVTLAQDFGVEIDRFGEDRYNLGPLTVLRT